MRLYKFIRVTYVIPLLLRCLVGFCTNSERWKKAFRQNENIGGNAWAGPPEQPIIMLGDQLAALGDAIRLLAMHVVGEFYFNIYIIKTDAIVCAS